MNTNRKILNHKFLPSEELWLSTVAANTDIPQRVQKAKLFGKIEKGFTPDSIDSRFYRDGALTAIGIRRFDSENTVFINADKIICEIRATILASPIVDQITIGTLVSRTGLSERDVRRALGLISDLGAFISGGTTGPDGKRQDVWLSGPNGYDEYLNYEDMDTLLDRQYDRTDPGFGFYGLNRSNGETTNASLDFGRLNTIDIKIKRDIAFVIMPIDPERPELVDVLDAIKNVCREFEIKAYRADEIEHQDVITKIVLAEIRECEYLIADLSDERPNVYYEVGYAHAMNKRPILFRRAGTKLHFDLAVHNVPTYKNIAELRELLRRRFEAILGRNASAT